jgi:excisionase family DNA binding protein
VIGTDVEGERFYTIPEVARILRVSDQSVRRWIKAGQLRATKPGKEYRIGHTNLEEFLRAREPRPKAGGRSSREPTLWNGLEEERRTTAELWAEAHERAGLQGETGTWQARGGGILQELPRPFQEYVFETLQEVERGEKSAEEAMRELAPEFAAG